MKPLISTIQLNLAIISLFIVLVSFSTSCANRAARVDYPKDSNPRTEMTRLEEDLYQAELNKIDITAPGYFSLAKKKLAEAQKLEIEGKTDDKILRTLGEARGALNYAIIHQQDYRSEINDILEARQMALTAGALEHSPSEFQRTDWELKEAIKDYKPNKRFLSYNAHQTFKNRYYNLQSAAIAAEKKIERTIAIEELNFSPEQAEVYRDGEKILIRLKATNFAPGDTDLSTEAYQALDKVKEILSGLNEEHVKIEGFTDSTGSPARNLRLSEDRAEAVADYLLDSDVIKKDQIEIEGLGAKKPVTSNLTKEGRAMNRRVDIIIRPTKTE